MLYIDFLKQYEGQGFKAIGQIVVAAFFFFNAAFNEAHWLLAYNYWVLSFRVELIKNAISPNAYNFRFNALNIVVSLINVMMPAMQWVLYDLQLNRAYVIFGAATTGCMVVSCAFLVWGFIRLIKSIQSRNRHPINKAMIFWHIVAYFFIMIAYIVQNFTTNTILEYEVSTIIVLVIEFVCSVIMALIVNEIISKSKKGKFIDWTSFAN